MNKENSIEQGNKETKHYFCAPEEDKSSRFCICGKYLTDEVHKRANGDSVVQASVATGGEQGTKS